MDVQLHARIFSINLPRPVGYIHSLATPIFPTYKV
ncbi:hypothetical protein NP493_729g01003 [Ridgeia piscesae]|uniref:Uncharacterized protein n=1 Tax=Ridgeia piscesae TaxID=27915 RepID=A0AAD9KRR3_RIDPI|nr:hypothetical protein NP493_729g01003 [Ridgeia piscesae]